MVSRHPTRHGRRGLDVTHDAASLQMFVNASEIAIRVSRDSGPMGPADFIEFWGEGVDLTSTDTQIYWLVNGNRAGKRVGRLSNVTINDVVPTGTKPSLPAAQNVDALPVWLNGITFGVSGSQLQTIESESSKKTELNSEA